MTRSRCWGLAGAGRARAAAPAQGSGGQCRASLGHALERAHQRAPLGGIDRRELHSAQVPASALRGVVIRAFGRREVGQKLRASLERLDAWARSS
jgi:hypothetical protein